jgi:hypothetical protein
MVRPLAPPMTTSVRTVFAVSGTGALPFALGPVAVMTQAPGGMVA